MKRLIFGLCFVLIALMGIACASACDADNCTCDSVTIDEDYSSVESVNASSEAVDNQQGFENISEDPCTYPWCTEEITSGNYTSFLDWAHHYYGYEGINVTFCGEYYGEYIHWCKATGKMPEGEFILDSVFKMEFDGEYIYYVDEEGIFWPGNS